MLPLNSSLGKMAYFLFFQVLAAFAMVWHDRCFYVFVCKFIKPVLMYQTKERTMKNISHLILLILSVSFTCMGELTRATDLNVAQQAFQLRLAGRSDQAESLLREAIAKKPDATGLHEELARTLYYHMELDAAQQAIDKARQLAPENARCHYLAGMIATYNAIRKYRGGDQQAVADQMKRAVDNFTQAIKLKPDYSEARLHLIQVYANNPAHLSGDKAKAKEHVRYLEKTDPVYGAQGRCSLERDAQAQVMLCQATVTDHPQDSRAHERLGVAYMHAGDLDQASDAIYKAAALAPQRSRVLFELALSAAQKKQYTRAEKALKDWLGSTPKPPVPLQAYIHGALGQLAHMQGDVEKGRELRTQAKELDPHCWFTMRPPPECLFNWLPWSVRACGER